jgi:flagellar protein FliO/FliZ
MRVGLGLALLGFACGARAAEPVGASAGHFAQAVLGLALVLALIGGAAWLLRRLGRGVAGAGSLLRTVAHASLGTRERVVVVEIGDVWLVLGVTPQSVTSLHSLPRGVLPPAQKLLPGGFAELLARARGRDAAR